MAKRVLYIHPGAELYGSDRMAVETVSALRGQRFEVAVVLPQGGPLVPLLEAAGAKVLVIDIPVLRKEYLKRNRILAFVARSLFAFIVAIRFILLAKPDLVYVNTIIQPTWMLAARFLNVRLICHVREAENSVGRAMRFALVFPLSFADLVVSNSRATEHFILESSIRRPRRHVVIYNGKDWGPYFVRAPRPMPTEPSLIVVGRLSPRKGQHLVLAAMDHLRLEGIVVTATFVGDVFPGYEWYAEELRNTARTLSLADKCTFAGFTPDIANYLAAADIAVVPSLVEPFGTVAAESMAAMRPTIASRTEGLQEIIEHQQTGLLFEPGDPAELANAIRSLIEDTGLNHRLTKAGFEAVHSKFSRERYAAAIGAGVTRTLGKRHD
jgi:glycosyltransferase involved in cell wall biosynthesis